MTHDSGNRNFLRQTARKTIQTVTNKMLKMSIWSEKYSYELWKFTCGYWIFDAVSTASSVKLKETLLPQDTLLPFFRKL